ncbi:MAG: Na+:solute symporter [Deltaproteobacteria bacterium]|nr:Na+:solute symporter [Deltaproteobacteria bacterium]
MSMNFLDWSIVFLYGVFALAAGFWLSKRAGRSTASFFVSDRNLSWWLLGTSMVATTFAADTPLAVSGLVAQDGIAGNWLWWNLALAHLLAAFLFAKLWRRIGTVTDLEFIEIRYFGRPASVLRGFRAVYEGVLMNAIIMGWVMLAMSKVLGALFSFPKLPALGLCLVVALIYTVMSGFWGVVVTDLVQFIMAMTGSVALAVFAIHKVGGLKALTDKVLACNPGADTLSLVPKPGTGLFVAFLIYLSVGWWTSKGVDGGGYIAQRMLAAKDEGHARLGTLWFAIAHYTLRPWPWILVGLASIVAYGGTSWFKADPELGYAVMIKDCMPAGFRGLMVASFFAAFMSTIDTHLNWGASYLVNDFYKRFLRPGLDEGDYVKAARVVSILLMVAGLSTALLMQSISGAWKLLWQLTAGVGGVYIARWLWWRVNAWSEITSWISSSAATLALALAAPNMSYPERLSLTAGFSTLCWLVVTFATTPVPDDVLLGFYRKVRPGSVGWSRIAAIAGPGEEIMGIGGDLWSWALSIAALYGTLFGVGELLVGKGLQASLYLAAAFVAGLGVFKSMPGGKYQAK